MNAFTELEDNDTIRVVLRNPMDLVTTVTKNYGKETYYPMVKQSDSGLSKFYSILRFLVNQ